MSNPELIGRCDECVDSRRQFCDALYSATSRDELKDETPQLLGACDREDPLVVAFAGTTVGAMIARAMMMRCTLPDQSIEANVHFVGFQGNDTI
jgi:hypothetical protein